MEDLKMKKTVNEGKGIVLGMAVLMLAGTVFAGGATSVEAKTNGANKATKKSSSYVRIFDDEYKEDDVVNFGEYTFAIDGTKVMIKSKNAKEFEQTDIDTTAVTNGKVVYFTKGLKLKKLTLKTMKIKNVASIKRTKKNDKNTPDCAYISSAYGNQIFVTRNSWGSWKEDTFSYNMKSGKVKKLFKGEIVNTDGKYVVVYKDFGSDVHTSRYDIYKVSKNKIKKVKRLAKKGLFFGEIKGKLYYAEYTNDSFEKGVLYRCDVDGKNIEELAVVDDILSDVTEHSYMLGMKKIKY